MVSWSMPGPASPPLASPVAQSGDLILSAQLRVFEILHKFRRLNAQRLLASSLIAKLERDALKKEREKE